MDHQKKSVPSVLYELAHLLGTEIHNRRLEIPDEFGSGYCAGYVFNEHIRMLISNYELTEDVLVINPEIDAVKRMIVFKFQNIFPQAERLPSGKSVIGTPAVLIATSRMSTDKVIPVHTNTATINIEVDASYLKRMFDLSEKSPVLQSLLENTQPLLFEQIVYPSLQKIVDEIVSGAGGEAFELFFLRIKAEELICRLLMELEKRDEKRLYALNNSDIQTIYKVKEQVLKHLENPPVIKDLALSAGMSPTKLKYLFKQIFGNSIFNYYQRFRMKEAARLLKEEKLTVSDTGYRLGFTNLSHFSRVFEQYIGSKPKKYSVRQAE